MWRNITLSTATLWTYVTFGSPRDVEVSAEGSIDQLEAFLLRSKSAPLHICLSLVSANISTAVRIHSIIEKHTGRIREFELNLGPPSRSKIFVPLRGSFARLEVLKIDVGSSSGEWNLSHQRGETWDLFRCSEEVNRKLSPSLPLLQELYLPGLTSWTLRTDAVLSSHLRQHLRTLYWNGSWTAMNQMKKLISGGNWKQLHELTLLSDGKRAIIPTLEPQTSDNPNLIPSLESLTVRDKMDTLGPTFPKLLAPSHLRHLDISAFGTTPALSESPGAASRNIDDCQLPSVESISLEGYWLPRSRPHSTGEDKQSFLSRINTLPPILRVNHPYIQRITLRNCVMTYSIIDLLCYPQRLAIFPVLHELKILHCPMVTPSDAPDFGEVVFNALTSRPMLSISMEWFALTSNMESLVDVLMNRIAAGEKRSADSEEEKNGGSKPKTGMKGRLILMRRYGTAPPLRWIS